MAEESQVVRGIDWRATLPFTQIFRSFRVAIHPSKLVLALLALVLIYLGGRTLDGIWSLWPQHRAVPDEMVLFEATRSEPNPTQAFNEARNNRYEEMTREFKRKLAQIGKPDGSMADLRWAIRDRRDRAAREANEAFEKAPTDQKFRAGQVRRQRLQEIYASATREWDRTAALHGHGPFAMFFEHQLGRLNGIVQGVRSGNWIARGGVSDSLVGFFVMGPWWALRHHYVYFTLFGAYFLVIWSVFGGAIARIAAVHVARDEKLSIRQALAFSIAKFLSFLSAPLIPLLIILAVGIVVAAGGFLVNIPFLGPIVVGALFFLALAAGFIMTLVLIGTVGGFNLMYPTIAVEGSDSFDAISRSFSYLYARPWRLAFYTLVAALYGALCYLFARYFMHLLLSLTHYFAGWWVFRDADNATPLFSMLWPGPLEVRRLSYEIDFLTLSGAESFGAFLIAFWVYLAIATLGAFVISFYFSTNTVIYFLMRNEVDATELDDVYLEQTDEEFQDGIGGMSETTTTVEVSSTATTSSSSADSSSPDSSAAGSSESSSQENPSA